MGSAAERPRYLASRDKSNFSGIKNSPARDYSLGLYIGVFIASYIEFFGLGNLSAVLKVLTVVCYSLHSVFQYRNQDRKVLKDR